MRKNIIEIFPHGRIAGIDEEKIVADSNRELDRYLK